MYLKDCSLEIVNIRTNMFAQNFFFNCYFYSQFVRNVLFKLLFNSKKFKKKKLKTIQVCQQFQKAVAILQLRQQSSKYDYTYNTALQILTFFAQIRWLQLFPNTFWIQKLFITNDSTISPMAARILFFKMLIVSGLSA